MVFTSSSSRVAPDKHFAIARQKPLDHDTSSAGGRPTCTQATTEDTCTSRQRTREDGGSCLRSMRVRLMWHLDNVHRLSALFVPSIVAFTPLISRRPNDDHASIRRRQTLAVAMQRLGHGSSAGTRCAWSLKPTPRGVAGDENRNRTKPPRFPSAYLPFNSPLPFGTPCLRSRSRLYILRHRQGV